MEIKNKGKNKVLPYTYLLKFNYNNSILYYYGVRYGNVSKNTLPINDIFKKYYSSSKNVQKLLNENITPYEIIIHKTFNSIKDATDFEIIFLTRINAKNRNDFLNRVEHFNSYLPYQTNKGSIKTPKERKKMSKISSKIQNNTDYKKYRKKLMNSKWNTPEFKSYMDDKNTSFWSSTHGIELKENLKERNISNTGTKHTNSTKQKMSKSAKLAFSKIDCSKRALNRKRYMCPTCNVSNLDGGNFNRHMKLYHDWNKTQCQLYKSSL